MTTILDLYYKKKMQLLHQSLHISNQDPNGIFKRLEQIDTAVMAQITETFKNHMTSLEIGITKILKQAKNNYHEEAQKLSTELQKERAKNQILTTQIAEQEKIISQQIPVLEGEITNLLKTKQEQMDVIQALSSSNLETTAKLTSLGLLSPRQKESPILLSPKVKKD